MKVNIELDLDDVVAIRGYGDAERGVTLREEIVDAVARRVMEEVDADAHAEFHRRATAITDAAIRDAVEPLVRDAIAERIVPRLGAKEVTLAEHIADIVREELKGRTDTRSGVPRPGERPRPSPPGGGRPGPDRRAPRRPRVREGRGPRGRPGAGRRPPRRDDRPHGPRDLKALTLTQPWASLVAIGAKATETRSWSTSYRGPLAIHAAKGLGPVGGKRGLRDLCLTEPFLSALGDWRDSLLAMYRGIGHDRVHGIDGSTLEDGPAAHLPLGAIVAVARLHDVLPTPTHGAPLPWINVDALGERERAFGDYSEGRFAWLLRDVVPLDTPVPCRGALGLWNVPDGLLA